MAHFGPNLSETAYANALSCRQLKSVELNGSANRPKPAAAFERSSPPSKAKPDISDVAF
jgi:hypothetical protein